MKYLLPIALILLIAGLWAYTAYAVSEGANSPGTLADDATVGTVAWTNPTNAGASDNVYATVSGSNNQISHYLKATNFGFSIPTGTIINGILVEIERSPSDEVAQIHITDTSVKIVKSNGIVGATNKGTGGTWLATEAYYSYGSSSDLWGETWASTDINDIDFGVVMSVTMVTDSFNPTAYVDHIRITVYYTEAVSGSPQQQVRSGTIQVRSGTLIVK